MKQLIATLTLSATVLAALPDPADAFRSRYGSRVNQVNEHVFEVVPRSSGSGGEFWCAAGDYAQSQLRASWQDRVYIARGRGPSETTNRRSAVQFTLNPAAAGTAQTGGSFSLGSLEEGDNMSVQQAYSHCAEPPRRF